MGLSWSAEALVINAIYDASVNSAPSSFRTAFQSAASFFRTTFTDPITVNMHVGWGEVGGSPMSSGALGQSITYLAGYDLSAGAGARGTSLGGGSLGSTPSSQLEPVPEPASLGVLGMALLALAGAGFRRSRAAAAG